MKIAVDAYYLRDKLRGMARYAQMLVQSLPESDRVLLPKRPVSGLLRTLTEDQKWFPLWEQFILPLQGSGTHADYLLCSYNTGPVWLPSPPVVVVIHDLIFLDDVLAASPSRVQNLGRAYRRFVCKRIARKSVRVITCSEYSRKLIIDRFQIPEEKIVVIPNIVGESWFENDPQPDLVRPYVIAVAGEAPSKNAARLIEAMTLLPAALSHVHLKIVGIKPRFHAQFRAMADEFGISDRVEFVPYVEDDVLRGMYSAASAFVCPSLAEGFGIPLLEAMASGIPAASSDRTSLPEVAGDTAIYFNPESSAAIACAMVSVLDNSFATQERARRGRTRARLFTPGAVQSRIAAFWSSLTHEPSPSSFAAETYSLPRLSEPNP